jgi:hypothetical protein
MQIIKLKKQVRILVDSVEYLNQGQDQHRHEKEIVRILKHVESF